MSQKPAQDQDDRDAQTQEGERELQLYLILPEDCGAAELSAALEAAPIACLLIPPALAARETSARVLVGLAQGAGAACLVADDAGLAGQLGADGVHLTQPIRTAELRAAVDQALGGDGILGVYCATSRHAAMEAGEAGADYVAFDANAPERADPDALLEDDEEGGDDDPAEVAGSRESLSWWQALMTLPCVAWEVRDEDAAIALADAGADVLALDAGWLRRPQAIAGLVERLSAG